MELTRMIMEAETCQGMSWANWRPRKVSGVIQSEPGALRSEGRKRQTSQLEKEFTFPPPFRLSRDWVLSAHPW